MLQPVKVQVDGPLNSADGDDDDETKSNASEKPVSLADDAIQGESNHEDEEER